MGICKRFYKQHLRCGDPHLTNDRINKHPADTLPVPFFCNRKPGDLPCLCKPGLVRDESLNPAIAYGDVARTTCESIVHLVQAALIPKPLRERAPELETGLHMIRCQGNDLIHLPITSPGARERHTRSSASKHAESGELDRIAPKQTGGRCVSTGSVFRISIPARVSISCKASPHVDVSRAGNDPVAASHVRGGSSIRPKLSHNVELHLLDL